MIDIRFAMSGKWKPIRAQMKVTPRFTAMCRTKIGMMRNQVS